MHSGLGNKSETNERKEGRKEGGREEGRGRREKPIRKRERKKKKPITKVQILYDFTYILYNSQIVNSS